jgi:hypothetical protein
LRDGDLQTHSCPSTAALRQPERQPRPQLHRNCERVDRRDVNGHCRPTSRRSIRSSSRALATARPPWRPRRRCAADGDRLALVLVTVRRQSTRPTRCGAFAAGTGRERCAGPSCEALRGSQMRKASSGANAVREMVRAAEGCSSKTPRSRLQTELRPRRAACLTCTGPPPGICGPSRPAGGLAPEQNASSISVAFSSMSVNIFGEGPSGICTWNMPNSTLHAHRSEEIRWEATGSICHSKSRSPPSSRVRNIRGNTLAPSDCLVPRQSPGLGASNAPHEQFVRFRKSMRGRSLIPRQIFGHL